MAIRFFLSEYIFDDHTRQQNSSRHFHIPREWLKYVCCKISTIFLEQNFNYLLGLILFFISLSYDIHQDKSNMILHNIFYFFVFLWSATSLAYFCRICIFGLSFCVCVLPTSARVFQKQSSLQRQRTLTNRLPLSRISTKFDIVFYRYIIINNYYNSIIYFMECQSRFQFYFPRTLTLFQVINDFVFKGFEFEN